MTPAENKIFYSRMFNLALPIALQHLMLASVAAADAMMLGRVAQAEMTVGIMVGNELGAGKLEQGKRYGIKLRNVSWAIGLLSTALVLAVTPFVVRFVILTDEARRYLTVMMVIMAIYMIGRSVNTITINGVLDGGGDTLFDMYCLAVSMWGIAIPLALAGAFFFHWPVLAVYACTCLDEVGKIPWVMIHFNKYKWVRDLTREREQG